jgi:selenide,water dikinase
VPPELRRLLFDAQTSGGLLIAVEAGAADALVRGLLEGGYAAAVVGSVHEGSGVRVDF